MPALLMLLTILAATPQPAARGAIEATIRGTAQPLEVELLRQDENEAWQELAHQSLAANVRRVRFDELPSGVYQVRILGPLRSEVMGTKVAVGSSDTRRTTITIQPAELAGRVTLGGTPIGTAAITLTHPGLGWRAGISVDANGTFRVPIWQRAEFRYTIQAPVMATPFASAVDLTKAARFDVDIPDGRIRGVVVDGKSGTPVSGALVGLASKFDDSEQYVKTMTDADGRYDFTGIQDGTHTVRIIAPLHLEPAPSTVTIDRAARLREVDFRLDAGRTIPLVVIDAHEDPVDQASVLAVVDGKVRARARTDEDGRTSIAVPEGESATLFVVPPDGTFGVQRIARDQERGRVRVYLPAPSSSLLIRARTTDNREMPPFSLLMRYNGELMPVAVAEELGEVLGLRLATGRAGEALLENIPSGSYEFWPYRTDEEAESIAAAADVASAPIVVTVRTGENRIAVKFASRR